MALTILALSTADGVLTVTLIDLGAVEINPFMALFVPHSLGWFSAIKLWLTAMCLAVLVACSRMRLMRVVSGEIFLYIVLGCYLALIGYELRMLQQIAQLPFQD